MGFSIAQQHPSHARRRTTPTSTRGEQRHFQLGPRIRIGGTLGKIGQNVKVGAGKVLSNKLVDAGLSLIPGVGPGVAAAANAAGHVLDTSNGGIHSAGDLARMGIDAAGAYGASKLAGSVAGNLGFGGVGGGGGGGSVNVGGISLPAPSVANISGASGGSGGGFGLGSLWNGAKSLLGNVAGDVKGDVQKTTQNQNYSVDTNTRNQLGAIQNAYTQAGQAGPSPLLTQAGQFGSNAQNAGNLGFGALSGNADDVSKLMNPYQQQVIDANNKQWQQTNQQTMNQVNDAATRAGAFGGSRHGVAEGVALAQNNMNQQNQTANLLSQGYGQAQNQAAQLAGLGFQGAGLNANLGFGGVGSPSQWYAQMLRQGFIQPTGGTSGGASTTFGGGYSGGIG